MFHYMLIDPNISIDFLMGIYFSIFKREKWNNNLHVLNKNLIRDKKWLSNFDNSCFNIKVFAPPKSLTRKDIRLTVDYPEDLILCRNIYHEFKNYSPLIPLEKVVNFIDKND